MVTSIIENNERINKSSERSSSAILTKNSFLIPLKRFIFFFVNVIKSKRKITSDHNKK